MHMRAGYYGWLRAGQHPKFCKWPIRAVGGDAFKESEFNAGQNDYVIEQSRIICMSVIAQRSRSGADNYCGSPYVAKNTNIAVVHDLYRMPHLLPLVQQTRTSQLLVAQAIRPHLARDPQLRDILG
jgi:hypothetical protein